MSLGVENIFHKNTLPTPRGDTIMRWGEYSENQLRRKEKYYRVNPIGVDRFMSLSCQSFMDFIRACIFASGKVISLVVLWKRSSRWDFFNCFFVRNSMFSSMARQRAATWLGVKFFIAGRNSITASSVVKYFPSFLSSHRSFQWERKAELSISGASGYSNPKRRSSLLGRRCRSGNISGLLVEVTTVTGIDPTHSKQVVSACDIGSDCIPFSCMRVSRSSITSTIGSPVFSWRSERRFRKLEALFTIRSANSDTFILMTFALRCITFPFGKVNSRVERRCMRSCDFPVP